MPSLITDNITEILQKIIEFTEIRRQVLTDNISNVDTENYCPKELDVSEFADLMIFALAEHLRNSRLLLCDSQNVKFVAGGGFDIKPVIDSKGQAMLKSSRDGYLKLQISRLAENLENYNLARELLCRARYGQIQFTSVTERADGEN